MFRKKLPQFLNRIRKALEQLIHPARSSKSCRKFCRVLEELEPRLAPASVSWAVDNSGFWDVGSNWSTGTVPGANDVVVIDRPAGNFSITYRQDTTSVKSLLCKENLVVSGGSLGVTSDSTIVGGLSVTGGAINVVAGTLNLAGGGTSTGGTYTVASGATLNFGGGTHSLSATSTLGGAGVVTVASGTLNEAGTYNVTGISRISGGTANFNSGSSVLAVGSLTLTSGTANFSSGGAINAVSLTQTGGTLTGSDTVSAPGLLTWSGGTMSGTGQTSANGGLVLTGFETLDSRIFNNAAMATSTGTLTMSNGAVFNNMFGATFDSQYLSIVGSGSAPAFNNAGTFKKSAVSITSVGITFNNTGTVQILRGNLELAGGGSDTGSFTVAQGSYLIFSSGTHTLGTGSSVAGAGTVYFGPMAYTGNATVSVAGTYNVTGITFVRNLTTVSFSSGSRVLAVGDLTIEGGTANFSSGTVVPTTALTLIGTLTGSDTVTVSGVLSWISGTMSGTGQTTANGGLALENYGIGNPISLIGRTLTNTGSATVSSGSGVHLNASNSAVINNLGGATWDFQNDFFTINAPIGTATFNNYGTVKESAGTGTFFRTYISAAFNNSGTVQVLSGTMELAGGGNDTGSFAVAQGTTLKFSGGTHTLAAGSGVAGAGTVMVSGFTTLTAAADVGFQSLTITSGATVNGSGNLSVSGLLTWNGGTMSDTGQITASGGLALGGGTLSGRTLNNIGSATVKNGILTVSDGAVINNLPGGTWDFQDDYVIDYSGAAAAQTFNNYGTFKKSAGTGISSVTLTFNNTGILEVDSGTLSVQGSISNDQSAIVVVKPTQTLVVNGNLSGNTLNGQLFAPRGTITLGGTHTSTAPQLLEVMSQDVGNVAAGFTNNFHYGTLVLGGSNFVRLVDSSDNAAGTGREALYVDSLRVPSGSTLDLNSLHVYARSVLVNGTVIGGTINQIGDGGNINLGEVVPGKIAASGEIDDWSFFGRTGQAITVIANPGTTGSPAPVTPTLDFAQVTILDPSGNVLATGSGTVAGQVVTLSGIPLAEDGTYYIQVRAASTQATRTGNYMLTVGDATVHVASMVLGQQVTGVLKTAYSADRWTFSAQANQQIKFDWINAAPASINFKLSGPNNFTAFSGLTGDSDLITLSWSGSYTVEVSPGAGQPGSYAFRLIETTQQNLAANVPYNGTLVGSGAARLFKLSTAEGNPLQINFDDSSDGNHTEVFARLGSPPTRREYDYSSAAPGADQVVRIPFAAPGTWYILIYSESVASPSSFTLSATSTALSLQSVTPDRYAGNQTASLTVLGAGFLPGSQVYLVSGTGSLFAAQSVTVNAFDHLTSAFDLTALPQGAYDVRVSLPGGQEARLPAAFQVLPEGQAHLQTRLILPKMLGRHFSPGFLYVEYSNTGTAVLRAPILILQSADPDNSDRPLLTLDQSRLKQLL